ncbi:MAG: YgjP-like metallopeptidase domain-containing protein [Bacteroidota bacterium]
MAKPEVKVRNKKYIDLYVRPSADREKRQEVMREWYRAEHLDTAGPLIEEWKEKIGLEFNDWGVRRMKTKWGSCNAEEEYFDQLLSHLQQYATHISFVDQYSEMLKDEYPYEMLELYDEAITEMAQQTGRKNYREVASWIRKMKKIPGGDEKAYELFEDLLEQYRNRPAMKDEFGKAFPEWDVN